MQFDADINARSLGGYRLGDGRVTLDTVWRAGSPDPLGRGGWDDVVRAGIRRVVDLRNRGEVLAAPDRPQALEVMRTPLEDPEDPRYTSLWERNWAHPDFYAWGLVHWPRLWHAAFTAIGDAPSGAVLIHCAGGRDRTGMLSAILLDLAGAERAEVIEDYAQGMRGTNEMLRRQGLERHEAAIPAERLESIIAEYGAALDQLLQRLPILLRRARLDTVAKRAASRLVADQNSR